MPIQLDTVSTTFMEEIQNDCRVDLSRCYECGKCSGGCSTGYLMDYTPRQIIQLIKLGAKKMLLESKAIWICLSCHLCQERCPAGIDIPRIMDYLREVSVREGVANENDEPVLLFNNMMLDQVFKRGRVSEAELALRFNLRAGKYTKDLKLGQKLFLKGKMRLLVPGVRDREAVRRTFRAHRSGKGR